MQINPLAIAQESQRLWREYRETGDGQVRMEALAFRRMVLHLGNGRWGSMGWDDWESAYTPMWQSRMAKKWRGIK